MNAYLNKAGQSRYTRRLMKVSLSIITVLMLTFQPMAASYAIGPGPDPGPGPDRGPDPGPDPGPGPDRGPDPGPDPGPDRGPDPGPGR